MPDGTDRRPGRVTANLRAEWLAALHGLELDDVRLLAAHGLNLPLLVDLGFDAYALMVGAMPMRVEGRRWSPDPTGHRGFVTPVRGRIHARDLLADEIAICGPLIDLVAWHPETAQAWATRRGDAEWLGGWDPGFAYDRTAPVRVWRAPFAWLCGWMDGVVPLTTERWTLYRLLVEMPAILAEDEDHARRLQQALERPFPVPPVRWRRAR
jgi:hypothetical protein